MPYLFHLFTISSLDKVNNLNAFKLLSTIINSPSSAKALAHKESVRLIEALIFRTFYGRGDDFSLRLCGLALYSDLSVVLRNTKYSERLRELIEHEMAEACVISKAQCD